MRAQNNKFLEYMHYIEFDLASAIKIFRDWQMRACIFGQFQLTLGTLGYSDTYVPANNRVQREGTF